MHKEFKLLDHGYVKLIDFMGSDLAPLEAARMSTDNPTGADEGKDDRLRTRLWGDKHTSPFEMNELVIEIQCPMFVLRQLDRHRTITLSNHVKQVEGGVVEEIFYPEGTSDYDEFRKYTNRNEFSGRYSKMPDLYYLPPLERIRKKGVSNKQGSAGALDPETQKEVYEILSSTTKLIRSAYEAIIGFGVASELARLPLPQNQYTKIRLKASLLHWLKLFDLRLRTDVQEETRAYAQAMAHILRGLWPKCWDVFEEHNLYSAQLSRTDRLVLHSFFEESGGTEGEDRMMCIKEHTEKHGYTKRQWQTLLKKLMGPEDDLMELLDCVSFMDD